MSGIGAKLSRHVLGMKFMRKTKDQFDKERVEKVHREHFAPVASDIPASVKAEASSSGIKNEPTASKSSLTVEELWSYNQCERYIFGRQSFGGFNPVVEKNLKKGIWKPFYMEDSEYAQDDSDEEQSIKKNQSDVDVSDEEMSKTYGSLIGTLAKRFTRKNKQEGGGGRGRNRGNHNHADNAGLKKQNKKGRFRNNKRDAGGNENPNANQGSKQQQKRGWGSKGSKKRQRESTGSTTYEHQEERNSRPKRRNDNNQGSDIPQKRRKFLKPSDD